ncbi:hypothetical protein, partial [Streptosporangium sp. NPDC087985]|uniref:hypothetical protein n=1 Tax=Streptosporangium sp. NPDC087985 TaxID=3366196 RepID=UPI00380AB781
MKRVIKAAVAVATFGLAAAISAPAQAQSYDIFPAQDGPGGTFGPIGELTGGILDVYDVTLLSGGQGMQAGPLFRRELMSGRGAVAAPADDPALAAPMADVPADVPAVEGAMVEESVVEAPVAD